MAAVLIETYELPTYWASYFINGDPSCLEEADIAAADGWWQVTFSGRSVSCTDVAEESSFCRFHDADQWCLRCGVSTFSFLIHQEV